MPATPTRDRVNPEEINTKPVRRPDWIKVKAPSGEVHKQLKQMGVK